MATSNQNSTFGHDRKVTCDEWRDPQELIPAPENDIYRPVCLDDPAIIELSEDIQNNGFLEPLLVTQDDYILSGHRRRAASLLLELDEVPVRYEDIYRADDIEAFTKLLVSANGQRIKTVPEQVHEAVIKTDPEHAYRRLQEEREAAAEVSIEAFRIEGKTTRSRITRQKRAMVDGIIDITTSLRKVWPLSDRQIFYGLLNIPGLLRNTVRKTLFRNDDKCYGDVTDLLLRMRLAGLIPYECIQDETRPTTNWDVHQSTAGFVSKKIDSFLKGYHRDLLQSQPNQIEILVEKNTLRGIVRPIASKYCVPMMSGRGYSSLEPRRQMVKRFQDSGKQKLILLIISDFDPDGEMIAHSFPRSLRDDFGVDNVYPIKVAVTKQNVEEFELPNGMKPKKKSPNYAWFVEKYGKGCPTYEVESLQPDQIQTLLADKLQEVLDLDRLEHEKREDRDDAVQIQAIRQTAMDALGDLEF